MKKLMYDLVIYSPCANCTFSWLPLEWKKPDFLIKFKKIKEHKVILEDINSDRVELMYYPSPSCLCEFSKKKQCNLNFDLSVVSPITQIDEVSADYGVYVFSSIIESREVFANPVFVSGYGCDRDKDLALLKSKMEVLERMCFYLYPRNEFRFIAPDYFFKTNYWENQLPPFLKTGQFFYIAKSLNDNSDIYVPAFMVLSQKNTFSVFGPELNYCGSSKGMSVHFSKHEAIENGLIECMENIGNSILWKKRFDFIVDLSTLPDDCQYWLQLVNLYCEKIFITFLEPFSGFFSATAVGFNGDSSRPCAVVCSGGGRSPVAAIIGSLRELYSQVLYAKTIQDINNDVVDSDVSSGFFHYLQSPNGFKLMKKWGLLEKLALYEIKPEDCKITIFSPPESACYIDRGNPLLDSLGLACVHVFVPELWQISQSEERLIYPYA